MIDFHQHLRQRKVGDAGLQTRKNRHDCAASFRSLGRFAGARN